MDILSEDYRKKELKKLQENLRQIPDARLYVWGCASTAEMITEYIETHSTVKVAAYIVDDLYYKDEWYNNRKVLKASEWEREAKKGDYVVMGFTNEERAKTVISGLKEGVNGLYFYFPYSSNAYGTCLSYDEYCAHKADFEKVYDMLADELSKETMEAFINGCISGRADKLNALKVTGQYFNDLTKHFKVHSFVDCGAYTGDTIEGAKAFYGEGLTKIISLEPDEKNIELLKERVEKCNVRKEQLLLVAKGSWSKRDTLHFSSDNSSSSISDKGDITIEVDCLDHVLQQVEEPIDYIKMDVEGSEKESLLGAAETIRKYHPLLAICVYHKPEDLFELPKTIAALTEEFRYQFYLRYYGPDLRELVLYALPEDIRTAL